MDERTVSNWPAYESLSCSNKVQIVSSVLTYRSGVQRAATGSSERSGPPPLNTKRRGAGDYLEVWVLSWMWIWFLVFMVAVLSFGCFLGLVVLLETLMYRDLRRRLREERDRKEESGV